jgi:hypothetical protein
MEINGKRVINAKTSVVITISKVDVERGDMKEPESCAAALACQRQLHAAETRIHIGRCYLLIDGVWKRYQTSPALRNEIIAFDRGGTFEPGEYTLKRINPKTAVARPTKPKGTKDHRVKAVRHNHTVTGIREKAINLS